jgi:tetratricopeptide (TPR) repeat protein
MLTTASFGVALEQDEKRRADMDHESQTELPVNEFTQPPTSPIWAAAVSVCWVLLIASTFGFDADQSQNLPVFVWRDVAIVYLVSALPFAVALATLLAKRLGFPSRLVIGGSIWIIGVGILSSLAFDHTAGDISSDRASHSLIRSFLALGLVLPIAGIWTGMWFQSTARVSRHLVWLTLTAGVAVAIPETYVTAHCQHDSVRLSELMGQSRLGEAETLARRLLRFDHRAVIRGEPMLLLVVNLDRMVTQLRADVKVDLGPNATDQEALSYAQKLAILGRTDEALRAFDRIQTPSPNAFNLLGTIRESRSEWQAGLDDYRRAQQGWEMTAASPDRLAGLIRATTGVAFCLRKLGSNLAAEQAYQQLLKLAPNAETHFLLAQFYEDTQQTKQAYRHVRRAMELAPRRFQHSGQQLINKLTTSHFGCFNVFSTTSAN